MGGAYAEPGFLSYTRSGPLGGRHAFAWFCVPGLSGVALGGRVVVLDGPKRDPKRPAICTRIACDIHRSPVAGGRERGTLPPEPGIIHGYPAVMGLCRVMTERGPLSVMRRKPANSEADLRGGGE
jgi:hypothetical protein